MGDRPPFRRLIHRRVAHQPVGLLAAMAGIEQQGRSEGEQAMGEIQHLGDQHRQRQEPPRTISGVEGGGAPEQIAQGEGQQQAEGQGLGPGAAGETPQGQGQGGRQAQGGEQGAPGVVQTPGPRRGRQLAGIEAQRRQPGGIDAAEPVTHQHRGRRHDEQAGDLRGALLWTRSPGRGNGRRSLRRHGRPRGRPGPLPCASVRRYPG